MNSNLKQMRAALVHRQRKMITQIEINYLKQMNQLIREKEASIKQINANFAKEIKTIDKLITQNHQRMQQQKQQPRAHSNPSSPQHRQQPMSPPQALSNNNAQTQNNNAHDATNQSIQLSTEQIIQLLQQTINYELASKQQQNINPTSLSNNAFQGSLSDSSGSDTTNSLNSYEQKPIIKANPTIKAEKMYKCSLCEMRFDRKSALSKHELCHRGSQRYECNKCHKKFSSLSEYLYHCNHKHQNM